MADVPPEVYELVRLVVHLARYLYTPNMTVETGIPSVRKRMISVLASDMVRPNAAHMTTITPIIFRSYSGGCVTTPASSA